jgi:hypothetical protein
MFSGPNRMETAAAIRCGRVQRGPARPCPNAHRSAAGKEVNLPPLEWWHVIAGDYRWPTPANDEAVWFSVSAEIRATLIRGNWRNEREFCANRRRLRGYSGRYFRSRGSTARAGEGDRVARPRAASKARVQTNSHLAPIESTDASPNDTWPPCAQPRGIVANGG